MVYGFWNTPARTDPNRPFLPFTAAVTRIGNEKILVKSTVVITNDNGAACGGSLFRDRKGNGSWSADDCAQAGVLGIR